MISYLPIPLVKCVFPLLPEEGDASPFALKQDVVWGSTLDDTRLGRPLVFREQLPQHLVLLSLAGADRGFPVFLNDARPDHLGHVLFAPVYDATEGVCRRAGATRALCRAAGCAGGSAMLLGKDRNLIAEPAGCCSDLKRPRLPAFFPVIGCAALVHGWRHHGKAALTANVYADAGLAGGRGPAERRTEEQLNTAATCFLLDRIKLACGHLDVRHFVPPSLSPNILVEIEIDHEDAIGAGPGDDAHVVATRVFSAVAIPALEGEVGGKLVLKLSPLGEGWSLPLGLML